MNYQEFSMKRKYFMVCFEICVKSHTHLWLKPFKFVGLIRKIPETVVVDFRDSPMSLHARRLFFLQIDYLLGHLS